MSYKNDHMLTIANKFGKASSEAKAQLFETYDRLRDITVSGSAASGSGFGTAGSFLWQIASLFSPGAFMPIMGGNSMMNIAGTSFWSPVSGGTSIIEGGSSAFGIGNIGSYPGFPSGAAYLFDGLTGGASMLGWGSQLEGSATGGAAGVATGYATSSAAIAGLNAAAYAAGTSAGMGFGSNVLLPIAGMVSGWGGIMQAMAPYLGEWGLPAIVMGNLMQGTGSAAASAYANITGRITANADVILSDKVRNIETVVKMLDTQGDVVRKMLKDGIEGDQKNIQNM